MSLPTLVRQRLLSSLGSLPRGFKDLVVDLHSSAFLSTHLTRDDILSCDIGSILAIEDTPLGPSGMPAVFIVYPTSQNVFRIMAHAAAYPVVYLLFIDCLPDALLDNLRGIPNVKSIVDLTLFNASPHGGNCFTLPTAHALGRPSFFVSSLNVQGADEQAQRNIRQLSQWFNARLILSVLVQLGEDASIRHSAGSPYSVNLARILQSQLEQHSQSDPSFPPAAGSGSNRPKGIVLLLDRADDLFSCILHDFHYGPMTLDLLSLPAVLPTHLSAPSADNRERESGVEYKSRSESGAREKYRLGPDDSMWLKLWSTHVSVASAEIQTHVRDVGKIGDSFKSMNSFIRELTCNTSDHPADIATIQGMMANMSSFEIQKRQAYVHTNLATEVMAQATSRALLDYGHVEMMCCTGLDKEGKPVKSADLVQAMVPLLDSESSTSKDKARLIMLYILFKDGVIEEDKRRLFMHSNLDKKDIESVEGLKSLGCRVTKKPGEKDLKKPPRQDRDYDFDISRYQPLVKCIVEDMCNGKLDLSRYPVYGAGPEMSAPVVAATSLRTAKPSWHKAATARSGSVAADNTRQRIVIFCSGGVSLSEIRALSQLSELLNKDIYIGSSHVFTPEQFLDDLRFLPKNGRGSKFAPDMDVASSRLSALGPQDYQAAYDSCYFTEDSTPPPPMFVPPAGPVTPTSSSGGGGSRSMGNPSVSPVVSSGREEKRDKDGKKKGWRAIF